MTIKNLENEITDRKNLTKDIIDETSKTINEIKKECLEYTYGREIGNLNNTINDERIRSNELINIIEYLEDVENESLEIMDDLNIKLEELKK